MAQSSPLNRAAPAVQPNADSAAVERLKSRAFEIGSSLELYSPAILTLVPELKAQGLLDQPIFKHQTALTLACGAKNSRGEDAALELIAQLFSLGADPNAVDRNNDSPLMRALYAASSQINLSCKDAIARMALAVEAGSNVGYQTHRGTQAIHLACREACLDDSRLDLCRALLAWGADPSAAQKNGFTPLHHAAKKASLSVARFLVDAGANVLALHFTDGQRGDAQPNARSIFALQPSVREQAQTPYQTAEMFHFLYGDDEIVDFLRSAENAALERQALANALAPSPSRIAKPRI